MSETITARKVAASPHFALLAFLALFFVLPYYGSVAVMVACATFLSILVAGLPEQFRDRSGSMKMAHWLVAALWVAAAVVAAMTLMGEVVW